VPIVKLKGFWVSWVGGSISEFDRHWYAITPSRKAHKFGTNQEPTTDLWLPQKRNPSRVQSFPYDFDRLTEVDPTVRPRSGDAI
jgi:hypothetical protein